MRKQTFHPFFHFRISIYTDFNDRQNIGAATAALAAPVPTHTLVKNTQNNMNKGTAKKRAWFSAINQPHTLDNRHLDTCLFSFLYIHYLIRK